MGTINTITLSGRLTADPELRITPQGTSVASCTIAVDDGFGDNKKTYFPEITAWKHNAEYLANYGKKGMLVTVHGRYTEHTWEKDGQHRKKAVIVANDIVLPPKGGAQSSAFGLGEEVVEFSDEDLPF